MVIQLVANGQPRGYVPKVFRRSLAPFLPGGNVAFRRRALDDIGRFDDAMRIGEDQDMCIRAQETRWHLYFDPDLVVEHNQPASLRAVARQWFGYGHCRPFVLRKHNPPGVEVLTLNTSPDAHLRYTVLFYRDGGERRAFVFVTSFALMHACLGLAAITIPPISLAFLGAAGIAAVAYFKDDFSAGTRPLSLLRRLGFLGTRYLVNASLLLGGIIGGLEAGYLYVEGTLWKKCPASPA